MTYKQAKEAANLKGMQDAKDAINNYLDQENKKSNPILVLKMPELWVFLITVLAILIFE